MTIATFLLLRPWHWFITGTRKCHVRWCPYPQATEGPWSLFTHFCREHTDEITGSAA